jgi:hypothetical protein
MAFKLNLKWWKSRKPEPKRQLSNPIPMPMPVKAQEEKIPVLVTEDTDELEFETCVQCSENYPYGEPVCPHCGVPQGSVTKTFRINSQSRSALRKTWPKGDVIVSERKPIMLHINGVDVPLPIADSVIVGRSSPKIEDTQPDVDLTPYGGHEKGVSRQHIKITRRNILIYITDLGSSNGSYLNGHRLIPNTERVLRSGDELQLGHLKADVYF